MTSQVNAWAFGPKIIYGLYDEPFIKLGDASPMLLTHNADGSLKPYLRYIPPGYQVIGISDCRKYALVKREDGQSGAVRVLVQDRMIQVYDGKPITGREDGYVTVIDEFGSQENISQ